MAKKQTIRKTSPKRKPASGLASPIDRKYRKNFLKQVIARMDFAVPVSVLEREPPKAVVAALKKQLITGGDIQRTSQESVQWFFHSKNRDKRICIAPDFMFVEYEKYKRFELLQADFVGVAHALFDAFENLQVKRLGLRYIDNIEFPREKNPTDWKRY